MSIRKILVPAQTHDAAQAGLTVAAMLARRFKAHIEAAHVLAWPPLQSVGYYSVGAAYVEAQADEIREALEEGAAKVKMIFDQTMRAAEIDIANAAARREGTGATATWRQLESVTLSGFSEIARVCDLVVIGRSDKDGARPDSGLVEELVFQSGRPILMTAGANPARAPRRLAIAWNGSREAARALTASEPFLDDAEAVAVVTIDEDRTGGPSPDSAVELLRLHGAPAEKISRPAIDRPEQDFLKAARQFGADLVIMGAYSHARWREMVLGGFTREMVRQTEFPVLFAH